MNTKRLKIIFAGTPEFAAKHLEALIQANLWIAAVFTQPDKPAGRGQQLSESPVKQIALKNQLPLFQPQTMRDEKVEAIFQDLQPDVFIDVAYGLLVPKNILSLPKFGCINVHPSLLPRWRGASPIQHAILAGDSETGVTIMQMDEGLDTGNILLQKKLPLFGIETSHTLLDTLASLGVEALIETLNQMSLGKVNSTKQNNAQSCYAKKIEKSDAKINWEKSAVTLDREIRAFNSWPVSFTEMGGQTIRIWEAVATNETKRLSPGKIIQFNNTGIDISTGDGILRILKLQFSGGKILSAKEILNSKKTFFENLS